MPHAITLTVIPKGFEAQVFTSQICPTNTVKALKSALQLTQN